MVVKRAGRQQVRRVGLSDKSKKILLGSTGGVLAVVLAVWAYYNFTTVAPPNIQVASAKQVTSYLGNERGFARLNHDNREKFVERMWTQFSQGDRRAELSKAFDQMTPSERQVFVDAAFDTAKDRFLKQANEYNRLPEQRKAEFVANVINNLDAQRKAVGGYSAGSNVAKSFEGSLPNTTDGITRLLADRTTARQRSRGQSFFDAIAAGYKERQEKRGR
jgi:hypothetical protein